MKQHLRLRGGVCSFRNQYKNIRFKALKLCAFRRFLHSALARAMSTVEMTMGTGFKLFALSFAPLKGLPLLKRTTYHLKLKRFSALGFSLLPFLFCVCLVHAQQPGSYRISGTVLSAATGVALEGATVQIKNHSGSSFTNADGQFTLSTTDTIGTLLITFLGHQATAITFSREHAGPFTISMMPNTKQLDMVEVSTGYQTIPKERATGSFVQMGNDLLNRSVSTGIMGRLKGVTPSLAFDERAGEEPKLSIRGRSTIFANDQPLIVLDNFPYEGDINNINPNDIESISILRDAAAASIWGIRAGNGVIVITTKKGRRNQPVSINVMANATIGDKPDLFYEPKMSTGDYIAVERLLFEQGYYDKQLTDTRDFPAISTVVELLSQVRDGELDAATAGEQLNELGTLDVRNDLQRYFYQHTLNQQYALSFRGGSQKQDYFVSIGFDRNRGKLVGQANQRLSTRVMQAFNPVDRLKLTYDLSYTQSNSNQEGSVSTGSIGKYAYNAVYDREGNMQPLVRDFRLGFAQSAVEKGLLDALYYPLNELDAYDNKQQSHNIRFSPAVDYRIGKGLSAQLRYQYEKQMAETRNLATEDAYSTRYLINQFTEVTDNGLVYHVPQGAILNFMANGLVAHNGRAQLNYGYKSRKHAVSAVTGIEVRQVKADGRTNKYMGYDVYSGTSKLVNYDVRYPRYPSGSKGTITNNEHISGTLDRFRSYYANALYEYEQRLAFSASARIDQTNLFGVKTNQRSVPLWSAGVKWNLSNEAFYHIAWLPYLRTRFTYGYNGNFDKDVTAFLTASYSRDLVSGERAALLGGLPNPRLRAEKTAMYNYAVEFGTVGDRVHGKVEHYQKRGTDLIGSSPIDPTTGKTSFRGNVADMKGAGWDIELSSKNITGVFKWRTDLLLSTVTDKITKYEDLPSSISGYFNDGSLLGTAYIVPIVGRPLFGVYSYPWAGLDENGDPQGYLDGLPSTNYGGITNAYTVDSLVFHGRATPAVTGSFRNTFSYRALSLSFNILFKTGYYFRRPSINYSTLVSSGLGHADYADRWQSPGDENHTNVPAFRYPTVAARETFYANTEILVEKGDHIRLQDVRLDYDLTSLLASRAKIKSCHVYLYANNLGILWRANKQKLDPDYSVSRLVQTGSIVFPSPRSIALGIQVGL